MTIAVIIPTLNEEATIASMLAETARLHVEEIVVVDGGSADRTVALVQAFCEHEPRARWMAAPAGRASQMNAGAKGCRGHILLFLHADTRLPTTAPAAIEAALADPTTVGGRFDIRFDRPSLWGPVISRLMNWRSRWSGIATGDQAIFVRRDVFERLGGFADVPLMEDVDFSRRLKRVGRIAALRETAVTSFRRWAHEGPLQTILLMWTLRFLYWIGVSPTQLHRWYRAVR